MEPDSSGRPDPDSRARTHLANERTFLAWLRTGLTAMALGLASAEFLSHDVHIKGLSIGRAMAVVLVTVGIMLAIISTFQYLRSRAAIDASQFVPARRSIILSAVLVALVGIVALLFVLLLDAQTT